MTDLLVQLITASNALVERWFQAFGVRFDIDIAMMVVNLLLGTWLAFIASVYLRWAWDQRRRLRKVKALGHLPLFLGVVLVWCALMAWFYGLGRLGKELEAFDMWQFAAGVLLLRGGFMVAAGLLLVPMWRAAGVTSAWSRGLVLCVASLLAWWVCYYYAVMYLDAQAW